MTSEPVVEPPTSSEDDKTKLNKQKESIKTVKAWKTTNKNLTKTKTSNKAKSRAKVMESHKSLEDSADTSSSDITLSLLRTGEILRDLNKFENLEENKTRNKVSLKITVKVGPKKIKALVDTSAQINAMSKDTFDELINKDVTLTTIPINRFTVRGAFTDKGEPIAFKTALDVQIGDKSYVVEFYIMKQFAYNLIIGMEFLARHRAIINCIGKNVQLSLEESARIAAIKRLTREEAALQKY